jgi:hypothetical protein
MTISQGRMLVFGLSLETKVGQNFRPAQAFSGHACHMMFARTTDYQAGVYMCCNMGNQWCGWCPLKEIDMKIAKLFSTCFIKKAPFLRHYTQKCTN